MTYQKIKKAIREMLTIEDVKKSYALKDAKRDALTSENGTMEDYISVAIAQQTDEAMWIWKIRQATNISGYDAERWWTDVCMSIRYENNFFR